jgi:CitB family two-component system response regulator MalR
VDPSDRRDVPPSGDRVLVVDDEPGVRALMARWARELGYSVDESASAIEALALFDLSPADIVLCDIFMPLRDGHWLVSAIRARGGSTAIVMVTGHHDVRAALTSLQHGLADYLVKPFTRERLREALTRAAAWRRGARSTPTVDPV